MDAVLSQTYRDFELLIINDTSTDTSLAIVESYKDPRIKVYTIPHGGVANARNYGIGKARYDLIAFLDADDIWETNYLLCMNELIKKFPQAGFYSSGYHIEEGGKTFSYLLTNKKEEYLAADYFKESVKRGLSVSLTSGTCVRKSVLNSMSLFRKGICRGEDIDVWLRVALNNDFAFCNKDLLFYRTFSDNSLSSHYTNRKDEFPYLEWLTYQSKSPYYLKYVVLVIYTFSKNAYSSKDYKTTLSHLWKIRNIEPMFKNYKRVYLMLMSLLRLIISR